MRAKFGRAWTDEVVAVCDPVFEAADVDFGSRAYPSEKGDGTVIFWMADPRKFFGAYPDSEVDQSYGSEWPDGVHDIDFTVAVDRKTGLLVIDVEGWNLTTLLLRAHGDGHVDGVNLARVFARLLGVDLRPFDL